MKYIRTPYNNIFVCSEIKDKKFYFYMNPETGEMISSPEDGLDEAFFKHKKEEWEEEEYPLSGKEAQAAQRIADKLNAFGLQKQNQKETSSEEPKEITIPSDTHLS